MISRYAFRKRYPKYKPLPDGTRVKSCHKIFLEEFTAAKTKEAEYKAFLKYFESNQ